MKTTLFGLCAVLACFAEAATEDADEWNAVAANRNLAGLTTALLARDASAAKPFFAFPVARPGLLPDIGEEEFESYFPVLFDDGFFAAFEPEAREKGTNLWEQIGWHGFFAPGLQSADARLVTDVSYESEKEKTRRKTFERVEILTLSPLLQEGVARPRSSFQTEDAGWRGRLDEMTNGTMRIALWRRGRSLSSVPDATCVVECIAEGSGGNCSFRPAGKAGCAPFAGLEKNVIGCDETPPLELLLCEKPGETNRLSATFVSWQKLRLAQSATEPSPIVPERQEADLGLTLHPSLTRTPFEQVLCFEADDGTLVGRIDWLPTHRIGDWESARPDAHGDFDDPLALYRIALFQAPVETRQKPFRVFYATRRVNGTSGTHTYVDVTWWYSLDVDVESVDPPGTAMTALVLNRWSVAAPELGTEMRDTRVPAHPVRWKDAVRLASAKGSPFATPLTREENVPATGRETVAAEDELLPPEYGLCLGMSRPVACLAMPGLLHRDGERNSSGNGSPVYCSTLLSDKKGRGSLLAAFENGILVWMSADWGYDDGWTANDPGKIREVLDDTLRRLGPPTRRWTKVTEESPPTANVMSPDPVEQTWHVWQWTKGDLDVLLVIRRSSDARRTLRAAFSAGSLRQFAPDFFEDCKE